MLLSMTGFGAAQGVVEGVEYAVEARSVNGRYFKAAIKLPELLAAAEMEVERTTREFVSRGTITIVVRMRLGEERSAYRVNAAALSSYLDQLRGLEVEANPTLRIDLGAMLQLPGVCEPPPVEELMERTRPGLMAVVRQALTDLVEMRRREGCQLREDLLANCAAIVEALEAVQRRSPAVVGEYQERLSARVRELLAAGKVQIDQDQLAREVAIFAERCDIAEEISRLRGHLDQFRQWMDSPEPSGRKLDFIAQEMLREANTIASKSNDAQIIRAVVDIKTAIDRLKEQVQNAE
jgi:uncharacterized protein (TIGR00255 family)